MTETERNEHISKLADFPERLQNLINGLDDNQLNTQYRQGGWTIRQVVHHLADSHCNGYIRFRNALSQDYPPIGLYDPDSYSARGDYTALPLEPSLNILKGLHQRLVHLLHSLSDNDWQRRVNHPERGDLNVDDLLLTYSEHCDIHYGHINSHLEAMGWK